MSYYKNLSPLARKQLYAQQKHYRSTQKNMCIVFPKDAHATIKDHADRIGVSVTRFMVCASLRMCDSLDKGGVFSDHVYDQD